MRIINRLISTRLTIFDKKEEKRMFANHSLQGIVYLLKTINKIDVDFYQEAVEMNLHFIVDLNFNNKIIYVIRFHLDLKKQ